MNRSDRRKPSRRELLRGSLFAGVAFFSGFEKLHWPEVEQGSEKGAFQGGKKLGVVEFTGETRAPTGVAFGAELDGRLYTDVSKLSAETPVVATEEFYLRTRASILLDSQGSWSVKLGGLVAAPLEFAVKDLKGMAKPMGTHLMECAGNARSVHFGMMSVADWAGVPVSEILDGAKAKPGASRVLISGFDTYAAKSASSVPGASWIFTREELKAAGAFLSMEMNGRPLTKDHGAPVRLVVPGWYGCACIKWVNEITLTDDAASATSQMEEYAARTMQTGVPHLAREYKPATVDHAAMPIRVEKWVVEGKITYRVFGIAWGGSVPARSLQIRFNPEEDYVPVDNFQQTTNDPWSFWTHTWTPKQPGTYMIRLRVSDPGVVARRLEAGYYMRTVEISET